MAYFTVEDLRAEYPELADDTKYPDDRVAEKIETAEQIIEDACDVAFIPREVTRDVTNIDPYSGELVLPHNRVREITEATGSTSGDIDLDGARIVAGSNVALGARWPANETITVTYTHGRDEPPLRILNAAKLYARTLLVSGPIDARATQLPTQSGGAINLLTPGLRGSVTGIPEVDAAIKQYQELA